MNKQEAIEKIKNLEGLTILDKTINFVSKMIPKKEVFNIINQIDEPEKPVVPQFIADWLEVCKENLGFGLSTAMSHSTSAMEKQPNKVKGWFNLKDNQETFAKAWLYGYEVEKEKLHAVEIPKFRFFGKVADGIKRMVMADYIDFKNEIVYYHYHVYTIEAGENTYKDGISFEDCVLMQSTGLKDKKGEEIFEGDIVIAWSQGVKGTFEIKRRIDGLWLLYPAWKDGQFWYLSPTEDGRETIEIIGNIYENPELLRG